MGGRCRRGGGGRLIDGGASRGNLLSGEADETILTVSRAEAEKHANPCYRAFFANAFNVTRALVLFFWEVALEVTAALRASRRDVRPRGRRGGAYPLLRGAMCVIVRDLIVFGVLTDMMRGAPRMAVALLQRRPLCLPLVGEHDDFVRARAGDAPELLVELAQSSRVSARCRPAWCATSS